jgi:hypothetical protein
LLVGAFSTGVEALVINRITFTNSDKEMLMRPLPQIARLCHLELNGVNAWDDCELGSWMPCVLPRLTGLQSLQLKRFHPTSHSHTKNMQQLSAAMCALTGFTRLPVVHSVPACDLVAVVSALSKLQDLSLVFHSPHLHVVHALGDALGQLAALSSLTLGEVGQDEKGDNALCQLLRGCMHTGMSSLQRLHLQGEDENCHICSCLMGILSHCSNLRTMLVSMFDPQCVTQNACDEQVQGKLWYGEVSHVLKQALHGEQQSLRLGAGSISGHRSDNRVGCEVLRGLLLTAMRSRGYFVTPGIVGIIVVETPAMYCVRYAMKKLKHLISEAHVHYTSLGYVVFGRRL